MRRIGGLAFLTQSLASKAGGEREATRACVRVSGIGSHNGTATRQQWDGAAAAEERRRRDHTCGSSLTQHHVFARCHHRGRGCADRVALEQRYGQHGDL
jgi:hypothetical protein